MLQFSASRFTRSPPLVVQSPTPYGVLVSRGRTATASNTSGGNVAANAVDSDYSTVWKASSLPATLEIDITGLGLTWTAFSWITNCLNFTKGQLGQSFDIVPGSYTIEASSGAGWTTLKTVSDNAQPSRMDLIDLTGYTAVRINITADAQSGGTSPSEMQVDLWNVSQVISADHALLTCGILSIGDSISAQGLALMTQAGVDSRNSLGDQVHGLTGFRTMQVNAGNGGYQASHAIPLISGWLGVNPQKYVTLLFGTNEAQNGLDPDTYLANMTSLCNSVIAAGRTPIVPTILWCDTCDVSPYNAKLVTLRSDIPQVMNGPDLYAFFNANQSLISTVHPTAAGYVDYMTLWVNWAVAREVF